MRVNLSHPSWKKSTGAKSDGSDSLLGIQRKKAMKTCQKHGEKYKFFEWIACFFSVKKQIMSKSLISLFLKSDKSNSLVSLLGKEQQEQFTHGRLYYKSTRAIRSQSLFFKERGKRIAHSFSLKRVILSERANSKGENSQPWFSYEKNDRKRDHKF